MVKITWLWFVGLLLCVSIVPNSGTSKELQLNPQATLQKLVHSVQHNATTHHVVIALAKNRRCIHPTFMVRLSGASLYLLDLVHNNHTNADHVVFSYPRLHEPGTYFLEVLTMYCKTFNPNAFSSMCLVHPREGKNVLTLPYSFEVKAKDTGKNPTNLHRRPRWVLRQNETSALLPTRYQKMCNQTFCVSNKSEIAQHNLYEWTDKPPYEHLVNKTLEWGLASIDHPTGHETITICMVGASHAGMIAQFGHYVHIPRVEFIWIPSRFPQLFEVDLVINCTYAVLGYGQWPLSSWMGKQAYTAKRYEMHMGALLNMIQAANVSTQMFLYSMNINGLAYKQTECPSTDFRHPPLTMMYNHILSKLTARYNVPYIDMFHLQGPLWDIALDWSHPMGRVATAEAEYVVHALLTYSHKHRRAPVLDRAYQARIQPPVIPPPVRFTDSETHYLEVNGKLRAVPDTKTLFHLGYYPSNSTVVDASRRSEYRFGLNLPNI